jgi:hypothetical protein
MVVWDSGTKVRAAELSTGLQWGTATSLHEPASGSPQCHADLDFAPGIGGAFPAVRVDATGRAVAVWAECVLPSEV